LQYVLSVACGLWSIYLAIGTTEHTATVRLLVVLGGIFLAGLVGIVLDGVLGITRSNPRAERAGTTTTPMT
jgi:hypothetical protein